MRTEMSSRKTHDPGGRAKPAWPADSVVTATFSDCGRYRYSLGEVWDADAPLVMWLLMNPSVAGVEHADPTLRRTGTYARSWGYGGQMIGNVHAYRLTDSRALSGVADPVGPENDDHLIEMARRAAMVVLAYGLPPKPLRARADRVVKAFQDAGVNLAYLRLSKCGTPVHPLYLPASLVPLRWGT